MILNGVDFSEYISQYYYFFHYADLFKRGMNSEAKFFLKKNFIKVSDEKTMFFILLCRDGKFDFLQALYNSFPEIEVTHYIEYGFLHACLNGHLQIAKWLVVIKPNLDVGFRNHFIFRECLNQWSGNKDPKTHQILLFLQELMPQIYFFDQNHYKTKKNINLTPLLIPDEDDGEKESAITNSNEFID